MTAPVTPAGPDAPQRPGVAISPKAERMRAARRPIRLRRKSAQSDAPVVILAGGIGRMGARYQDFFADEGCQLLFIENDPRGLQGEPRAAGIIVVTTHVSHPLRARAAELAQKQGCPIRYVDRPSLSAIKGVLRELRGAGP